MLCVMTQGRKIPEQMPLSNCPASATMTPCTAKAINSKARQMFETSYLLLSLVFSSIGLGYLIYGKKQKRKIIYYCGIALMVYPYAITNTNLLLLIGVVLLALPNILKRFDIDY